MGDWVLFDQDPETGTMIWMMLDGDKTVFRIDQNVDPILEANAEAEKLTQGKRFGDWNRIASVPLRLVEKTGLDIATSMRDQRFISKWMNDGDNAKFRTSRGRV